MMTKNIELLSSDTMTHRYGYISGSAKHRHKVHVLVELGPQCQEPDAHAGGEYEAHWAITACGIDSRTKSAHHHWRALVLGPSYEEDEALCAHCRKRRMKK